MTLATLLVVLCFALVHLFGGKLRFLDIIPRSRWLSAAGGVAVAYVFLHIFPELAASQQRLLENLPGTFAFLEHHIWLLALLGLGLFYGLERLVKSGRERGEGGSGFWLHIASFASYNVLIGYLTLHREEPDALGLLLYGVAIGLHFLTNDFGLRQDHRRAYDDVARWILAAAVLAGWCLGLVLELPEHMIAVPFAFLAGGVILNVLKEELPAERQSRFGAFAGGTITYAIVLLATA